MSLPPVSDEEEIEEEPEEEEEEEDELSSPFFNNNTTLTSITTIPQSNNRHTHQTQPRLRPSAATATTFQASSSNNTTPINALRRLASISQQQQQPSSSIGSSITSRRAGIRGATTTTTTTAAAAAQNVAARQRTGINGVGSGATRRRNDGMPTTPHAIRAMEERRRVAMTPSRERRRASGRGVERGSPFEILKALSRVSSTLGQGQQLQEDQVEGEDDEEEEEGEEEQIVGDASAESSDEIPRPPRLSLSAIEMRIEDDEDDTGVLNPPEMSRLDEEDFTMKSVEEPRRAELDASILARRRRMSDFSGLFGDGKDVGEDVTTKRLASPSFVAGEQGLFDNLAIGDETIDFGKVAAGRGTTSPQSALGRDIDLADSTFRFDIPQDITEGVSAEEDENEDLEDVEAEADELDDVEPADPPAIIDDDSGPEDFGSLSASEAEEDNAIEEDANIGEFLDDEAQEDEIPDDRSAEADEEEERIIQDIQPNIPYERENQLNADGNAANMQRLPRIEYTTELPSELEAEETQEVFVQRPLTIPIRHQPIPKATTIKSGQRTRRPPKPAVISKHGQKVPSLPAGVVKSVADSFLPHAGKTSKKTKKDTVAALSQATDWFFEQVASDLDAYSGHADRDMIEESDVVALMKRQRVLATGAKNVQGNRSAAPGSSRATLFSLAQRFLPRELMTELRMEPPPDERRKKRRRISEGGEFD